MKIEVDESLGIDLKEWLLIELTGYSPLSPSPPPSITNHLNLDYQNCHANSMEIQNNSFNSKVLKFNHPRRESIGKTTNMLWKNLVEFPKVLKCLSKLKRKCDI